jgi:hypothetical protein
MSAAPGIVITVGNLGFKRGQHVTVEIDGEHVDGVFVRQAQWQDRINLGAVPVGDNSALAWVRRLDTGAIEAFLGGDITAKPEADLRAAIGKAHEAKQDESGAAGAFVKESRPRLGVSIDLDLAGCQRSRRGLGLIKRTAMFIARAALTSLIANLTDDVYAEARQLLIDRKARAEGQARGS